MVGILERTERQLEVVEVEGMARLEGDEDADPKASYYILGTLANFTWALVVALAARYLTSGAGRSPRSGTVPAASCTRVRAGVREARRGPPIEIFTDRGEGPWPTS